MPVKRGRNWILNCVNCQSFMGKNTSPDLISSTNSIFIDAHVHIYKCFDPLIFLDSTFRNIASLSGATGFPTDTDAVLCLTEAAGDNVWMTWYRGALEGRSPVPNYEVEVVSNSGDGSEENTANNSLLKINQSSSLSPGKNRVNIYLLPGRQLRAKNKLEVSALGLVDPFSDGSTIDNIIAQVLEGGAIPVLPWGVGKWFGSRGKEVDYCLRRWGRKVMVSDNSNRPTFWGMPDRLVKAGREHIVLAGSDSLPLRSHQTTSARYGVLMNWTVGLPVTRKNFFSQLQSESSIISEPMGVRERFARSVSNQLAMQRL